MQALKILIVEDDLFLAERIADDLVDIGYVISANVANSEDALKAFRKNLPDLAVLDINLQESQLDGIELAREFNKIAKVPLIFLTGIGGTETVERSRKANPAYYLVKPYNLTQLSISIDFAIHNFMKGQEAEVRHSLQFQSPPTCSLYSQNDYFFVKKNNKKYIKVNISELFYIECENSTAELFTADERIIVYSSLSKFEAQIAHPTLLRIHRSFIVNLNKVVAFEPNNVFIALSDGQKSIPIGGKYKNMFKGKIQRLLSQ